MLSRQYYHEWPRLRQVCLMVLLVSLIIAGSGCTSIYRRSQTELPAEPGAELKLRVAETEEAEKMVKKAALRLLDTLERRKPSSATETDFDRVEAAAFELERRVCAAQDTADRSGKPGTHADTIARLNRCAQSWIGYVQTNRTAEIAVQVQQLKELLR